MIIFILWAIGLGRADIATEIAIISRHLSLLCHNHIDQWFNIYAHLKKHPHYKIVMDPVYMNVKDNFGKLFNEEAKWFEFYGDVKE